MLRLSFVFLVWMASTAYALEDVRVVQEAELHEAYALAWNEADTERRKLLARSQRAWHEYRHATCQILGEECHALMAQERTAELRHILLTETNVRTILPVDGRADQPEHLSHHQR
jgi:uncharacterized protein YecT (DUF1311 family)